METTILPIIRPLNFEEIRNTVAIGLKRGLLSYPGGSQQLPPMPKLIPKKALPEPCDLVCRNCGHEFFQIVKVCPKCLSPHVSVVKVDGE